ncbi:MAG: DUF4198 domain-containing protein [Thiolinea sp.]
MLNRLSFGCLLAGAILLLKAGNLQAHEFWLEPRDFTPESGEPLLADIKVGQKLIGNKHLFLPKKFIRFDIHEGDKQRSVDSRTGDIPAVNEDNLEDGLAILAYESTIRSLRYHDLKKFHGFLEYEGISWVKARHAERNLPETGFTEIYRRYAKTLVKSGSGKGADKPVGLPLELVMLNNPYTDSAQPLSVQLHWQNEPFRNAQINAFFRPDSEPDAEAILTPYHTDEEGKVTIPRPANSGVMLLNAVHMVEPDAATMLDTGAVWESLWASVTFAIE